jgi:nitroimidazol reductase NimA-like FMN-containing flavoprotein (pyridoxamine 5'-phosphate oxidase superfamily)
VGESLPDTHGTGSDPVSTLVDLDLPECLRLLADGDVGRIAVTTRDQRLPVIRPVNYVFDESSRSVLIRSGRGSKLFALLRSGEAVFEIDGIDSMRRVGWSVIVEGLTEEITHDAELQRIEALGLEPWAGGSKNHWIRIRTNNVTGRRIVDVNDHFPESGM